MKIRFRKRHRVLVTATILSWIGMTFGYGCSNVHLLPAQVADYGSTAAAVSFCTTPSTQIISDLKFIFIVDRSGSNQQRYSLTPPYTPLPGTDPTGDRRFGAIETFVNSFQQSPNIFWSMVSFNSSVLTQDSIPFTNNPTNFDNFVQNQWTNTASIDGGDTDYIGVVSYVYNLIQSDINAASQVTPEVSSNYIIFFISDGAPIVNGQEENLQQILNGVTQISDLQAANVQLVDGIEFNTGFYENPPFDPGASQNMQDMAQAGNGAYVDFTGGQTIDFTRYSVPSRVSKYLLKEFWIVDVNTIWEGSSLKLDSDGDGLSDDLEIALGSNPNAKDSDGNGVSDAVEYLISGKPCQDPHCSPKNANPYTSCLELQQPAGSPSLYLDSDGDGLNDCEEKLLGSNPKDYDSNVDYVPDKMALRFGLPLTGATNLGSLDPDFDGVSDYQELKLNTPLYFNNAQVPGLKMLQVNLDMTSSNSIQDCYNVDISNLATATQTDQIEMYEMENTQAFSSKRIFRRAVVHMEGGGVSAQDSDFIHVWP